MTSFAFHGQVVARGLRVVQPRGTPSPSFSMWRASLARMDQQRCASCGHTSTSVLRCSTCKAAYYCNGECGELVLGAERGSTRGGAEVRRWGSQVAVRGATGPHIEPAALPLLLRPGGRQDDVTVRCHRSTYRCAHGLTHTSVPGTTQPRCGITQAQRAKP